MNTEDLKQKIIVLGSRYIGKSNIILQFTDNIFDEDYNPVVEEEFKKKIKFNDKLYFLNIIETIKGSDEYDRYILRDKENFYGDGFLLVYDITNKSSFKEIKNLYEGVLRVKDVDKFPMILVGNKCDLEDKRVITYHEGWN
jgi:GTPase KRas